MLSPILGLLVVLPLSFSAPAATNSTLTLPVREVTVFKDGHALVLHEGRLPTNADGGVTLDNLPMPVLGTFWPYSADAQTPLVSVVPADDG